MSKKEEETVKSTNKVVIELGHEIRISRGITDDRHYYYVEIWDSWTYHTIELTGWTSVVNVIDGTETTVEFNTVKEAGIFAGKMYPKMVEAVRYATVTGKVLVSDDVSEKPIACGKKTVSKEPDNESLQMISLRPMAGDKFKTLRYIKYRDIYVPPGTMTNGADIPRLFWSIFPPNRPDYLPAVVIHDYLCHREEYYKADIYFNEALKELRISDFDRFILVSGVKMYHFFRYHLWNIGKEYKERK